MACNFNNEKVTWILIGLGAICEGGQCEWLVVASPSEGKRELISYKEKKWRRVHGTASFDPSGPGWLASSSHSDAAGDNLPHPTQRNAMQCRQEGSLLKQRLRLHQTNQPTNKQASYEERTGQENKNKNKKTMVVVVCC